METLSYQGLRDILAKANEFIEQQEKRMRWCNIQKNYWLRCNSARRGCGWKV
jgi:hypothetical protein